MNTPFLITGLVTAAGCFVGMAAWRWLLLVDRRNTLSAAQLCTVLIGAGLVLRMVYALLNPAFNSPDEQSHFNYVRFLVHEREFPVLTTQTDSPENEWEYHHPPLYYLSLTPLFAIGELCSDDPATICLFLRIGSILMWFATAWLALKWLKQARLEDKFTAVSVIGMVSLLPAYLTLSSSINNDILLGALAAAALLLISGEITRSRAVLIGVICGLAMLTKGTAPVIIFAVIAVLIAKAIAKELSFSRTAGYGMLVLALSLLIWFPWGWRNFALYGDPIGHSAAEQPAQWKSIFHALRDTQLYLKESFWSAAGIHNKVRFLPNIGAHLTYLALVGLLYGFFAKTRPLRALLSRQQITLAWALAAGVGLNLTLAAAFGMRYAHGHGRFLFPMLLPIGWFLALGLLSLGVNKSRNISVHAAGFFLTYGAGAVAFSLAEFARRGV